MTLSSIGFVPCAPLLVPEIAGGSAVLDDEVREAAHRVVSELVATDPAKVIVVAPTRAGGRWPTETARDFSGFGLGAASDDADRLPWQLGIGAWLLDVAGWVGDRQYVGIGAGTAIAAESAASRTAILALGDGSACRTERAPGYLDERAEGFDAAVADCLRRGDATGLVNLDEALSRDLLCAGLPVWRWVAAQLGDRPVAAAELIIDQAPYGVAYFVASWAIA